jgi:pimeloyl-ACP methyl ester carboxylesterase
VSSAGLGADAPVVLVHGLGSSSEHGWRAPGWIDVLADSGRDVLAIDLPGHGPAAHGPAGGGPAGGGPGRQGPGQQGPGGPAADQDAAAEVAGRFAELGPVDAVGFSAGAHLLVECAVRGLAPVRRLALLGVGPALVRPHPGAAAAMAAALQSGDESDPQVRMLRGMTRRAGNDPGSVAAFLRRPHWPLAAADLAAITCPVLVVTGERDPAGSAADLAAMFPDAVGRTIPGADHYSVQGDVRTMDAVLRFLGA